MALRLLGAAALWVWGGRLRGPPCAHCQDNNTSSQTQQNESLDPALGQLGCHGCESGSIGNTLQIDILQHNNNNAVIFKPLYLLTIHFQKSVLRASDVSLCLVLM